MNILYLFFIINCNKPRPTTLSKARRKNLDFINSTSILQYNMYQLMLERNYTTSK